jgi:hypothetical protein
MISQTIKDKEKDYQRIMDNAASSLRSIFQTPTTSQTPTQTK